MAIPSGVKIAPIHVAAAQQYDGGKSKATFKGRGRKNSIVKVEEIGETTEQVLDQSVYTNLNVEWIDRKGAWLMHPVLILMGKTLIASLPGMTPQFSWAATNLLYNAFTYIMFHGVTGIPFQNELHSGAYDDLTLWEQIDDGAQYTPAKKWLLCVPIALFLLSTHFTHYDPWLFAVNITALVVNLIPKLPMFHHRRLRFLPGEPSGVSTPMTPSFPNSRSGSPERKSR